MPLRRIDSTALDASERADRKALETCARVRDCLRLGPAAISELYTNTAIDELVLNTVVEQMLAEETPLSLAASQELAYLEGQLAARPGVGAAVLSAAAE